MRTTSSSELVSAADRSLKDLSLAIGADSAVKELFLQETEFQELLEVELRGLCKKERGRAAVNSKPWDSKLFRACAKAVRDLIGVRLFTQPNKSFEVVAMSGDVAASVASGTQSNASLMKTLVAREEWEEGMAVPWLSRGAAEDALYRVGREKGRVSEWQSSGVEGRAASWLHKGFCESSTGPMLLGVATCKHCTSSLKDKGSQKLNSYLDRQQLEVTTEQQPEVYA